MAQTSYSIESLVQVPKAKVAIIQSKWYREYSDSMTSKCVEVLKAAGCSDIETHVVPGCLEIPLAAKRLKQRSPDLEAIVVFGIILKGDTYHFEMVKDLCMSGLERVMFECDVPIINEVLPVDKIEYAAERAADNSKNKGIEAGLAAAEIIDWRRRNPITPNRKFGF
jgi:6,7-dimethyl-8-ribityllumazine synthase